MEGWKMCMMFVCVDTHAEEGAKSLYCILGG